MVAKLQFLYYSLSCSFCDKHYLSSCIHSLAWRCPSSICLQETTVISSRWQCGSKMYHNYGQSLWKTLGLQANLVLVLQFMKGITVAP
jgi:hypothetical protein